MTNLGEYGDKDIQNVKFTCPRAVDSQGPKDSWHPDSDGSDCGQGDPVNKGEGVGFPDVTCDGDSSPLRADVHMPSCYNPKAGIDDYVNNMEFPTLDYATGNLNCREGWIHVPHMFYEIYWQTPNYKWTQGEKKQPFLLSNGDVTGFSSHADFMSGWDEDILQNIIDNCNVQHAGMHTCPGVVENKVKCTTESNVDEDVFGPLNELPGSNPLLGWSYGTDGLDALIPEAVKLGRANKPSTGNNGEEESSGLPDVDQTEGQTVENAEQKEKPEPKPEPVVEVVEEPSTSCEKKIHTAMETVTVTEEVVGEPTDVARRHLHGHQHGHLHRRH